MILYTHEQLLDAYRKWIRTMSDTPWDNKRRLAWDEYVDVRDSLALGTTTQKRLKKEARGLLPPQRLGVLQ